MVRLPAEDLRFHVTRREGAFALLIASIGLAVGLLLAAGSSGPAGATAVAADSVQLTKTVYVGHDGGAQCASAAGFAEASQFDQVTYCFTVTNTGASPLGGIVVFDPLVAGEVVAISADSSPLAPGDAARYYLEATPPPDEADGFADDTYINIATVTAVPVAPDGTPVDGAPSVSASAEAVVFPAEGDELPEPNVSLVATVYPGADSGAGCPADKSADVVEGAPLTYCFTVTNTGNTHLDSIAVSEAALTAAPTLLRTTSTPLAPGESAYFYADAAGPAPTPEDRVTAAVVVANSVDVTGADLAGLDDVSSTDGAMVKTSAATVPVSAPGPAGPDQTPPTTAPAAAAPAVAVPAAAPVVESSAAPALSTHGEEPTELAFTGWETWMIAIAGLGLIAAGRYLVMSDRSFEELWGQLMVRLDGTGRVGGQGSAQYPKPPSSRTPR